MSTPSTPPTKVLHEIRDELDALPVVRAALGRQVMRVMPVEAMLTQAPQAERSFGLAIEGMVRDSRKRLSQLTLAGAYISRLELDDGATAAADLLYLCMEHLHSMPERQTVHEGVHYQWTGITTQWRSAWTIDRAWLATPIGIQISFYLYTP